MFNINIFNNKLTDSVVNMVLTVLFSYSVVSNIIYSIGGNISNVEILVINFILISFFIIIYSLLNNIKLYMFITGIIIVAFFLIVFVFYSIDYYNWLFNFFNGSNVINSQYVIIFTISISLLISYISIYFIILRYNFYVLFISGVSMFVSQVIFDIIIKYSSFYVYILLLIIFFIRFVYIRKSSENVKVYSRYGIFIILSIPISLIVLVTVNIIPSHNDSFNWEWLNNKILTIQDKIFFDSIFQYEYFSLTSTGFGSHSKLGGNVELSDTEVLRVNSPKSIYLKGSIKDVYKNNSWYLKNKDELYLLDTENEFLDKDNPISNDLDSIVYFMDFYIEEGEISKIYDRIDVSILYSSLKTKTIFSPDKPFKIDIENNIFIKNDYNGSITSDSYLTRGFKYNISSYYIDYDNENFKDILRNNKNKFMNNNVSNDVKDINIQLPKNVTQRTKDLAVQLTENYNNNYDKAKSIEEYLSKNYVYTLTPGNLPKDKDFVDYFLFESEKGYCSYFSTAMVILCRSINIPSRYVEGYTMPKIDKDGSYHITNQQAHAWPEVYLDGIGWIPFEPTTGFNGNLYGYSNNYENFSPEFINNPRYQEYLDNLKDYDLKEEDLIIDKLEDIEIKSMYSNKDLVLNIV
ncbi:MAG: transglutaminase-like domain-containing protein, partial [Clostridiales bacterium]